MNWAEPKNKYWIAKATDGKYYVIEFLPITGLPGEFHSVSYLYEGPKVSVAMSSSQVQDG